MNRVLITGKNSELARDVFSRTACHVENPPGSSHSQDTRQAVFYSGTTPESAAGGTRHPSAKHTLPCGRASRTFQPNEIGLDARFWRDCTLMFLGGCFTVAVLVLVLL